MVILVLIAAALFVSSCVNLKDFTKYDVSGADMRDAVEYLDETGFSNGYSEFYTGDSIPELSSTHIPMYLVSDWGTLAPRKWLSIKDADKLSGNVFIILTRSQYDDYSSKYSYIRDAKIGYKNNGYVILNYKSNAELKRLVGNENGK